MDEATPAEELSFEAARDELEQVVQRLGLSAMMTRP